MQCINKIYFYHQEQQCINKYNNIHAHPPKKKKDKIMGRISTNNAVSRICTNSKQKGDHQKKQLALWINM